MRVRCLILFVFFASLTGFGQLKITSDYYTRFDNFLTNDGLSSNTILDLHQDNQGFLWIATDEGLNRYDGYEFLSFYHNPEDSTSISDDYITCIVEDSNNNLWIGTKNGLNRLDKANQSFIRYQNQPNDPNGLKDNYVRALYTDNGEYLWIETVDGTLSSFSLKDSVFTHYSHQPIKQPYYDYHSIYKDSEENLWFGGRNLGPVKFDLDNKSFEYLLKGNIEEGFKRENDVACIYEDSDKRLWVSGFDGAYIFDRNTRDFQRVLPSSTYDIVSDGDKVWLATGNGLYKLNSNLTEAVHYLHNENINQSLCHNHVNKIIFDNAGNLWIGTSRGLSKLSPAKYKFDHIRKLLGKKNSLSSNYITAFLEDSAGYLWIGTSDGLNRYNVKENTYTIYKKGDKGLISNRISCLYEDGINTLWIGHWAGRGFNKYDRINDTFIPYVLNPNSLKSDWYNDFIEDSNGDFFAGIWGSRGMMEFDRQAGEFTGKHFLDEELPENKRLSSHLVEDMLEDENGNIWVATTDNGVNMMNIKTGIVEQYLHNPDDSLAFWGNPATFLFEDHDGNIWVGGLGLNRFLPESNSFAHFTTSEGLPSNEVLSMLQDDQGNYWIATDKGLARWNNKTMDIRVFTEADGLQSNEFSRAALKLSSGHLLFGGNNGFNRFKPDEIQYNQSIPNVGITKFEVFDERRDNYLSHEERLELNYDENFFTIYFSSLDLTAPERNIFRYKLEGVDEDWREGRKNFASYTKIEPGKYTFLVQGSNNDFVWSDNTASIIIAIKPPFWQTTWFYAVIVFVFFGSLFYYFHQRISRLKTEKKAMVLEQQLLRSQMNPHFIFNSLSSIQSFFYENDPTRAARYLSRFAKMLRTILEHTREEFIPLDEEIKTLETYLSLQQLRHGDNFEYTFHVADEIVPETIGIPPMLAQPFIENAIKHGFSNQAKGYIIDLYYRLEGTYMLLQIDDNGIGLLASKKNSSKPEGENTHRSMSTQITLDRLKNLYKSRKTNIGLSIVDRSDLSKDEQGTRVVLKFPYKKIEF